MLLSGIVYLIVFYLYRVTLPDTELLLPADEHKSARDICGPALAKEGLDPNTVVLYVVSESNNSNGNHTVL